MLIDRKALELVAVSSPDPSRYAGVQLSPDGSTAATDGKSVHVLSPPELSNTARLKKEVKATWPPSPKKEIVLHRDFVGEVIKIIPHQKVDDDFMAAVLTKATDDCMEFATYNGKHVKRVSDVPLAKTFPNYESLVSEAFGESRTYIPMSAKALKKTCELALKTVADSGDATLEFHIGRPDRALLIRSNDIYAGRRLVALVMPQGRHRGNDKITKENVTEWEKTKFDLDEDTVKAFEESPTNKKADDTEAKDLLRRLVEWCGQQGGWDANVWADAKKFLSK